MVTLAQTNEVSIEDIDSTLLIIASRCRFSSPAIQAFDGNNAGEGEGTTRLLGSLYSRMQARESKWLTRLILKTYAPIILPDALIYRLYHCLLPGLLKVQNEFSAALRLLASLGIDSSILILGDIPNKLSGDLGNVEPLIGVKVGRQPFFKARSIGHCIKMAQNRRMSIEKKYDGEYFQLHIDMSKSGGDRIKIFSKSGKDSTTDRIGVHGFVTSYYFHPTKKA